MILCPISISDANVLVKRWHRHHRPSQGGLFAVAVAVADAEEPCGAAIVGRPVARMLQDGWTAEITRLVTDGTDNASSMLLGACRRAVKALGYHRLYTYTLPEEGGASLRAAGFNCDGLMRVAGTGGSWDTPTRPRVDRHPTQQKIRWMA